MKPNINYLIALITLCLLSVQGILPAQTIELWGTGRSNALAEGYIYKFNANASSGPVTIVATFDEASDGLPNGHLSKGTSDTVLYGATMGSSGFNPLSGYGVIYKINTVTGVKTKLKTLSNPTTQGNQPVGKLVRNPANGKYYGMTALGGSSNLGVIFEWDAVTNTYTKKIDFTGTNGAYPGIGSSLAYDSSTGFFYGLTQTGGTNNDGTFFKYDPATNTHSVITNLSDVSGYNPDATPAIYIYPNNDVLFVFPTPVGGINNHGGIYTIWNNPFSGFYNLSFFPMANVPFLNNNEYLKTPLGSIVKLKETFTGDPLFIGVAIPSNNATLTQRKIFTMSINPPQQLVYFTNLTFPSSFGGTDDLDFFNFTVSELTDSTVYGLSSFYSSSSALDYSFTNQYKTFASDLNQNRILQLNPQDILAYPNGASLYEHQVPCSTPTITMNSTGTNTCDIITFTPVTTGFAGVTGYSWFLNGGFQSSASTFTYGLFNDGDVVTCQITGTDACNNLQNITSNPITISTGDKLINTCGTVFNDGSGSSNYQFFRNCSWLIQPSGATSVTLTFNTFNTEAGNDVVRVYDGNSVFAPLIGTFSGNSIPGPITSSSGSLYMTFSTNGSVQAPGFTATVSCSGGNELFFSEYIEGTSFNKAIEIYNPSASPVSLSNYSVELYINGSTAATSTLALSGTIAPGDVYVIANTQADPAILNIADVTSSVCNFNGDDAIALLKNGVAIDIIGEIGVDPGVNWSVAGSAATSEFTLLRDSVVTNPETDWNIARLQWIGYPQNTFTYIGSHGTSTSLQEFESSESSFSIFPNPAKGTFTVNLLEINSQATFEICNLQGKVLFRKDLAGIDKFDVETELGSGVYLAKVSNDKSAAVQRLVIIR